MAELGQEAFPALHPQVRVFGQLPFDHQCLMVPAVKRIWNGVVSGVKVIKMLCFGDVVLSRHMPCLHYNVDLLPLAVNTESRRFSG